MNNNISLGPKLSPAGEENLPHRNVKDWGGLWKRAVLYCTSSGLKKAAEFVHGIFNSIRSETATYCMLVQFGLREY